jgi:hypothetical protein
MKDRTEAEEGTSLWRVIAAPTIWALHFLACYVVAAVYCAKAATGVPLEPVRFFIAAATVLALAAIAYVVARAWGDWGLSLRDDDLIYDMPEVEERHRFLSHMTLMLSALSALAVLYVALPAVFLETCR